MGKKNISKQIQKSSNIFFEENDASLTAIESFVKSEHDLESQRLNAGLLGKFFGIGNTANSNIAGLVILFCFVFGALITFFRPTIQSEMWKILSPIITLALGYTFGSWHQKN